MSTEREVLIAFLKLSTEGSAKINDISQEARVPSQITKRILKKNPDLGVAQLNRETLAAETEQRLRVAVKAIELGADIERVCKFLTWLEFEDIAVLAFEANDFTTKKHFRFSWRKRRWEIDILALREPFVVSADCKQWHHGWRGSASRKAAKEQVERTRALAEASADMGGKIGIDGWARPHFVPVILSLVPSAHKIFEGAPIVPVLQLRDFLQEMPAHTDMIAHFSPDRSDF